MFRALFFIGSMLTLAACTQPPAQVVQRGSEDFSRAGGGYHSKVAFYNGGSPAAKTYSPPVSQATERVANVSSISSSDLAPPPKAATPAPQIAKQDTSAPQNPWTGKPRNLEVALKTPTQDSAWAAKPAPEKQAYIWPVASKKIASNFGPKGAGKANDGVNIASSSGEPVWAAADGEVVYVDNALKGYGNMVLIKHSGGKTSSYAHLAKASVSKYDRVKQGDIIGYVGQTGNVKSPQLYFSMRQGTEAVDPQKLIGTSVAGL